MCMSKLTWAAPTVVGTDNVVKLGTKKLKHPTKWQVGYKLFTVRPPDSIRSDRPDKTLITFTNYHYEATKSYQAIEIDPTHVFKASGIGSIYPGDHNGGSYVPGFHIFTTPVAARYYRHGYTLCEVRYRKVNALGEHAVHTDYPVDCVIAQEMRIVGPYTEPLPELSPKAKAVASRSSRKQKKINAKRKKHLRARGADVQSIARYF
jgi:hypothetical protein